MESGDVPVVDTHVHRTTDEVQAGWARGSALQELGHGVFDEQGLLWSGVVPEVVLPTTEGQA